jgi:hypothetical protein
MVACVVECNGAVGDELLVVSPLRGLSWVSPKEGRARGVMFGAPSRQHDFL